MKELIGKLENEIAMCKHLGTKKAIGIELTIEEINSILQALSQNDWIKVKDRLPEDDELHPIYTDDDEFGYGKVWRESVDNEIWIDRFNQEIHNVILWNTAIIKEPNGEVLAEDNVFILDEE